MLLQLLSSIMIFPMGENFLLTKNMLACLDQEGQSLPLVLLEPYLDI